MNIDFQLINVRFSIGNNMNEREKKMIFKCSSFIGAYTVTINIK